MKIRNGFVSNSSSSSFIIDLTGTEKCPHCGRKGLTIESIELLCEKDYDSEIRAIGKEEITEHIKEWWFNEEIKDVIIDKVNNSNSPIMLSIDYHSDLLKEMITTDKDIEIIYDEEG